MIFLESSNVDRGLMKGTVGCEEWLETKRKNGTVLYLLNQTKQETAKTGPFITFLLQN